MTRFSEKLDWMKDENIRPYVFIRPENRVNVPGHLHQIDWFQREPIYKNPLKMSEVGFANQILKLEGQAFDASGMAMDRWVFYDCAVMPGLVAGYAAKTATLSAEVKKALDADDSLEWTPLSLFIIIPTMTPSEWVAHNLCSVNSLVSKGERLWGLGFMSKAFGLWYANIETCIGMTQWKSPAMKLHSHYGHFKILTAYTPVHTYAKTLTYRLDVEPEVWPGFLGERVNYTFKEKFQPAGLTVNPSDEENLRQFQLKIEGGKQDFYLDAEEILDKPVESPLTVYIRSH